LKGGEINMAERMTHYEKFERDQRYAWFRRGDDPLAQAKSPLISFGEVNVQRDIEMAMTIDAAHAAFDPVRMLETQMAMMPPAAQAEIRAELPFPVQEFIA
jgi:hypothetical protein